MDQCDMCGQDICDMCGGCGCDGNACSCGTDEGDETASDEDM